MVLLFFAFFICGLVIKSIVLVNDLILLIEHRLLFDFLLFNFRCCSLLRANFGQLSSFLLLLGLVWAYRWRYIIINIKQKLCSIQLLAILRSQVIRVEHLVDSCIVIFDRLEKFFIAFCSFFDGSCWALVARLTSWGKVLWRDGCLLWFGLYGLEGLRSLFVSGRVRLIFLWIFANAWPDGNRVLFLEQAPRVW